MESNTHLCGTKLKSNPGVSPRGWLHLELTHAYLQQEKMNPWFFTCLYAHWTMFFCFPRGFYNFGVKFRSCMNYFFLNSITVLGKWMWYASGERHPYWFSVICFKSCLSCTRVLPVTSVCPIWNSNSFLCL